MSPWLEIVLPVQNPGPALLETAASLVEQNERGFAVVLSDNFSTRGQAVLEQFCDQMKNGGIAVRRLSPPFEADRLPHWNWTHGQAQAEWLKLLREGEALRPACVQRLRQRIETKPQTRIVCCELESRATTQSGMASVVPSQESLMPGEFLSWLLANRDWPGASVQLAYDRAAWQAVGGYPPHLTIRAGCLLVAMLGLRHGIEIIHEKLVLSRPNEECSVCDKSGGRSSGAFEMWLMRRQLRNYCLSVKLPWP